MYRHIGEAWQRMLRENSDILKERATAWRRGPTIVRLEKPSRLDRARRLGYRDKQGFVVVRVKVGRGGMRRKRPVSGRRPKHIGVLKMKADVSMRETAERRVSEKFPNLKVLNSYFLFKDGKYAWYEVILVDPHHPAILSDKSLAKVVSKT